MNLFARLRRSDAALLLIVSALAVPLTSFAIELPPNTWVKQPAPTQVLPSGRSGFYEARGWNHLRYDATNKQMVFFDGYLEPPQYPGGNIYANSLWLYDPASNRLTLEKVSHWTRDAGKTVPLPENAEDPTPFDRHTYSCIVYSASRNAVYIWSGANNSIADGYVGDMWSYSLSRHAWRKIPGTHPFTVFEQAMSYDPFLERFILFGGAPSSYREGANTFVFDLKSELWTDAAPVVTPSPRFGQTLCFDPLRRVTWMFGGGPYQQASNELWRYDARANTWSQVPVAGEWPSARRFANMAYDTRRNVLLLHGGVTASNGSLTDTWVLDPARRSWRKLDTPASPPGDRPNYAEDMEYDPENDVFVLNRAGDFWLFRNSGFGATPDRQEEDVAAEASGVQFRLLSANPSRAETRMSFTLNHEADVRIDLLDSLGRRVSTIVDGRYPSGEHRVDWAGDSSRRRAASGVYFLRFTSEGRELKRKVVLVR